MGQKKLRIPVLVMIILGLLVGGPMPTYAQETSSNSAATLADTQQTLNVALFAENGGVTLTWRGDEATAAALSTMPTVRYGNYDLPMRLIPMQANGDVQPVIQELESIEWTGDVPGAQAMAPTAIDWENIPFLLTPSDETALPNAPITIFSKSRVRGQEIVIVAFSPLFQADGVMRFATNVRASMPNSVQLRDTLQVLENAQIQAAGGAPRIGTTSDLAPTNKAATTSSIKLTVTARGIQNVSGQALRALGFEVTNLAGLTLTHKGQPVAYEVVDGQGTFGGDNDSVLDNNEVIRFYAHGDGDYWSRADVYWLSLDPAGGVTMTTRIVTPQGAPTATNAVEKGRWENNAVYISQHAGPDGNHWYADDLKADPSMQGATDSYPRLTVVLDRQLPTVTGVKSTYTLNLITYLKGEYQVNLKVDGTSKMVTTDTSRDAATASPWQPVIEHNNAAENLQLTLVPGDTVSGLLVDSIDWAQPVALTMEGNGAHFSGIEGNWRYVLNGPANGFALYDITDPLQPVRLTGLDAQNGFEDGPDAHDYVATGPGTSHTPAMEAHEPLVFGASDGADAIYIAPAGFIDALQPLVAHREAQGYRVKVVDVQDIWNAWGYGHVDPAAIRSFLRFAVATWNPAPISVVLVSDGTRDPFNYEQRESIVNYIPPYLLTSFIDQNGFERFVDPWLGQGGCDNCYAQLDGDDPLNNEFETPGRGFAMDIQLGRLPVKSASEVSTVVSKIIRYETAQGESDYWRRTAAFLADDYIRPNGQPDSAGDFIKYSDDVVEMLPAVIQAKRVYYDPTYQGDDPGRETNAVAVRQRAIDLAASGPGLLTYNGHANHWQWAGTAVTSETPYIMGLYDVDLLQNRDQLFVGLSMTCYTAQFFQPSNSGTTLDERMFVHPNGGAAAVWGPSGLSVLHGHDDLQYGFHKLLWSTAPGTAHLGDLVMAGYLENMAPSPERNKLYSCCEDVRRTFVLFGDPLMQVQITPRGDIYLPLITSR